eukprot:182928_1
MSALTATNQCYDFLKHCDTECKQVIVPYFNGVQRTLFEEHNHQSYYSIPSVIKSICCAYYCKHLHYRLSFKSLFMHHPTPYHLSHDDHDSHCSHHWKSCQSIQRILHILSNFQAFLQSCDLSNDALSPFVTYKVYQTQQILHDITHINRKHPQNTIKFYIRNHIIQHNAFGLCDDNDVCTCADFALQNDDTEQYLKYHMRNIHQQLIHHCETKTQFEYAVSRIIAYNQSQSVFQLLRSLRSVASKLLRSDMRYRTLSTSNAMFQERLMGFEGVLPFLSLLGFEANAMGTKLVCAHAPSTHVITTAIAVIDAYHPEIQPTNIQQMNRNHTHTNRNHCVHFVAKTRKQSERCVMTNGHCHSVGRPRRFKRRSGSGLLRLKSSGTECVDIEDEVAVSIKLMEKSI